MICVSIARGKSKDLLAEHRRLVEQGAELVEWRIDYLRETVDLTRMLKERPGPVIVTCRLPQDGGKWDGNEAERLGLLRQAIVAGADYVDLEEAAARSVQRWGDTKRLVSMHDFRKTPDDIEDIHARLAACDADVVKIATYARRPQDNLRVLELARDAKIPTIGLCMGDIGLPTRLLANKFGSFLTYATFSSDREIAPGQISFRHMVDVYRFNNTSPKTEVYGVIGDPVAHSYSPLIHNASFASLDLDKIYIPFRIPEEDLEEFIAQAPRWGIKGLSVTIPHKEAVVPCATENEPAVEHCAAANTLIFEGDQVRSYNSDIPGAIGALEHALWPNGQTQWERQTVLLLGAGGAAKALAWAVTQRGGKVVVACRTPAKAEDLVQRTGAKVVEWDQRTSVACDVIINCTPIGMHPNVDASPIEKYSLKPGVVVFDTIYNPENTLLLKHARSQHCQTVSGMEMFVRQAARQFELFTGSSAPLELMRDTVRRAISPIKDLPEPPLTNAGKD